MNKLIPIFITDEGVPVTTSRAVAEQFGKAHKNVIRDIESLASDLELTEEGRTFNRLNFEPVNYTDAKGESRKQYTMTRDGFTLLAMGFTGQRALQFKIAYINAFNRMEAFIKSGGKLPKPIKGNAAVKALPDSPIVECTELVKGILQRCYNDPEHYTVRYITTTEFIEQHPELKKYDIRMIGKALKYAMPQIGQVYIKKSVRYAGQPRKSSLLPSCCRG